MKRNPIPPFALFALAALNASAAIYVPGLVQAKLPGDHNLTADIASRETASFVPGTLATTIDEHGTRENPYDGVRWTWSNTNTFAYAGSMFLEAGTTYRFAKYIDDSGDVWLGGTKIIENGGCTDTPVGAYTPGSTGWHAIEARFGNGYGGAGAKGRLDVGGERRGAPAHKRLQRVGPGGGGGAHAGSPSWRRIAETG